MVWWAYGAVVVVPAVEVDDEDGAEAMQVDEEDKFEEQYPMEQQGVLESLKLFMPTPHTPHLTPDTPHPTPER